MLLSHAWHWQRVEVFLCNSAVPFSFVSSGELVKIHIYLFIFLLYSSSSTLRYIVIDQIVILATDSMEDHSLACCTCGFITYHQLRLNFNLDGVKYVNPLYSLSVIQVYFITTNTNYNWLSNQLVLVLWILYIHSHPLWPFYSFTR